MAVDVKVYRVLVESSGYTAIDITEYVRSVVTEAGLVRGLAVVYAVERGCSVAEVEYELELLADLEVLLKNLGCVETDLCSVVLGREVIVPVVNGSLFLGQFKNIVLVDVSRAAGSKSVVIALEGVFKNS